MTSGNTAVTLDEQTVKPKRNNQKLKLFILCLFISVIMWFLIRLSKDYTQLVQFTVTYKGLQADRILMASTDTVFYANIQTKGYNLLLSNIYNIPHKFDIDLSQYNPKLNGNNFEINIETGTLHDAISTDFKAKDKIVSVLPVTLKVMLEKAFTKKVPVIIDADITYATQYNLNHRIYYDPDSITITGDQQLIKSVDYIKTEKKPISNLSSNTIVSLKLVNKFDKSSVRYSSNYIKLFIPVVQYTEESVETNIQLDSLKENYKITTFPDKVKVYFFVNLPDYQKVKVDSFSTVINATEIFKSKNNLTRVYMKHAPAFVKVQRIEPEFVEYLIHK